MKFSIVFVYTFTQLCAVFGLSLEEDCITLAGNGSTGFDDGNNNVATFDRIRGLVWWNELYVAQYYCIRMISTNYTSTLSGECGSMDDVDGDAATARFGEILSIVHHSKYLYVLDVSYGKIKRVSPNGSSLTMRSFDEGIKMMSLSGDTMYVTTEFQILNCSILDWSCGTLAGVANTFGYQDDANSNALFNSPYGSTEIWDTVVVADFGNHCLREIADGVTATLYGNATISGDIDGGDDYLYMPYGLTPTGSDTLLVMDYVTLREVDMNGVGVTLGSFSDAIYDVAVVGGNLYLAFDFRIINCSWESMITSTPSSYPTDEPTGVPSEIPTVDPMEVPIEVPTVLPTSHSSEAPTEPTRDPTLFPTQEPTREPTRYPTSSRFITSELSIIMQYILAMGLTVAFIVLWMVCCFCINMYRLYRKREDIQRTLTMIS